MRVRRHLRQEPGWPGVRPPFCGQSAQDHEASALRHAGLPGPGKEPSPCACLHATLQSVAKRQGGEAVRQATRPQGPMPRLPSSGRSPFRALGPLQASLPGPPALPSCAAKFSDPLGSRDSLHGRLLSATPLPPFGRAPCGREGSRCDLNRTLTRQEADWRSPNLRRAISPPTAKTHEDSLGHLLLSRGERVHKTPAGHQ